MQRLGAQGPATTPFPPRRPSPPRSKPEEAYAVYQAMARALRAAGFNLNLAPVVDLGFEPNAIPSSRNGAAPIGN